MRTFTNIIAIFLSIVFIALGVVFIVPSSRNFVLDTFARNSNLYKQEIENSQDIEDTYIQNLTLLTDMRLKLKDEELKVVSYQTQLAQKEEDINGLNTRINDVTTNLNNANTTIETLNDTVATLTQQCTDLRNQLNAELEKPAQDQALIEALRQQIAILEGNIDEKNSTIVELNRTIMNYEINITNLNFTIDDLESQCEALKRQIHDQEQIIFQLNEEIYFLANRSLNLSFGMLDSIFLVDNDGNIHFTYSSNTIDNRVPLSSLLGVDIYNLKVQEFHGHCSSTNYEDGSIRVDGNLTVRPENTALSVYLWDPQNNIYIDANDANIEYLIGLGYTEVCYDIYAVEYSNGVVSLHLNLNNYS